MDHSTLFQTKGIMTFEAEMEYLWRLYQTPVNCVHTFIPFSWEGEVTFAILWVEHSHNEVFLYIFYHKLLLYTFLSYV